MSPARRTKLDERQFERIARALAGPRRYEILREIVANEKPTPCTALRKIHDISAATMFHHIRELETAGLVRITREGKFMNICIQGEVLRAYLDQFAQI